MEYVYIVVVPDSLAADGSTPDRAPARFPQRSLRHKLVVWKAGRSPQRRLNWSMFAGLAVMMGISLASWAGVGVLISHLLRVIARP
jgi:hypothetical protein